MAESLPASWSPVVMSFMGELNDIGVADLLYLLALRQKTGRLSVVANGEEVTLAIDQGRMVHVTSSNMTLRLGKMLVRLEFLTSDRLRDALRRQEQMGGSRPLGSILIDGGYITESQLHQCVEEQCIEILSRVISADSGIFVFHADARIAARTEIVDLNSDRILLEATRRTDEMTALRERLPDDQAPLMLSANIDHDADTMNDTEIIVASALFGVTASMRDLGERVPIDDLTLWQTVIAMRDRGWIVAGAHDVSAAQDLPQIHVAAD
jgi:hypothetical protein